MPMTALRERVQTSEPTEGLLDDPDCLAEGEYAFSLFRFRYTWGTLFEVTLTNVSDGEDRTCVMALLPDNCIFVDALDTDTMGVGRNGITREVTYRLASLDN